MVLSIEFTSFLYDTRLWVECARQKNATPVASNITILCSTLPSITIHVIDSVDVPWHWSYTKETRTAAPILFLQRQRLFQLDEGHLAPSASAAHQLPPRVNRAPIHRRHSQVTVCSAIRTSRTILGAVEVEEEVSSARAWGTA